jgi:hypothetical protein
MATNHGVGSSNLSGRTIFLLSCQEISSFFPDLQFLYPIPNPLLDAQQLPSELRECSVQNHYQRDGAIRERDSAIHAMEEKTKRTPAEQHHFNTAKRALEKLGPDAVTAFRFLKTHRRLTWGFNPLWRALLHRQTGRVAAKEPSK